MLRENTARFLHDYLHDYPNYRTIYRTEFNLQCESDYLERKKLCQYLRCYYIILYYYYPKYRMIYVIISNSIYNVKVIISREKNMLISSIKHYFCFFLCTHLLYTLCRTCYFVEKTRSDIQMYFVKYIERRSLNHRSSLSHWLILVGPCISIPFFLHANSRCKPVSISHNVHVHRLNQLFAERRAKHFTLMRHVDAADH